ncbi:hypothetical protein JOD45_000005 [Scopulibacillus daqui]|uniref:Uncharacterized protein n=1 Tax=Scopulibacillus daqui TaxID=1469162 RepID=A0ABS2PUT3_9BACL|nr:hypothetical protein [Scopulibacillus daqui]MBM7643814.1 hypothetical protein [Scopulibacillus daqui]
MKQIKRAIVALTAACGFVFSFLMPADVSAKPADADFGHPEILNLSITPENEWLYDLDNDLNALRMGLTINEDKKLSVIASLAEGKLSDLKKLIHMHKQGQLSDQSYKIYINKVFGDYKNYLHKTVKQLINEAPNREVQEKLVNVAHHFSQAAHFSSGELINQPINMSKIDQAELAVKVLADYNKSDVCKLLEEGLDINDMSYVFVLSEVSGKSPEEVADLKLNKDMTYTEIAKALGINPSALSILK